MTPTMIVGLCLLAIIMAILAILPDAGTAVDIFNDPFEADEDDLP